MAAGQQCQCCFYLPMYIPQDMPLVSGDMHGVKVMPWGKLHGVKV